MDLAAGGVGVVDVWTMDKALCGVSQVGRRTDEQNQALRREGPQSTDARTGAGRAEQSTNGGTYGRTRRGRIDRPTAANGRRAFAPVARAKVEEAAGKVTDAAGAKALADGLMGVLTQVTGRRTRYRRRRRCWRRRTTDGPNWRQLQEQAVARLSEFAGFPRSDRGA